MLSPKTEQMIFLDSSMFLNCSIHFIVSNQQGNSSQINPPPHSYCIDKDARKF